MSFCFLYLWFDFRFEHIFPVYTTFFLYNSLFFYYRSFPSGISMANREHSDLASIDGDADRLVFFYADPVRHSLHLFNILFNILYYIGCVQRLFFI